MKKLRLVQLFCLLVFMPKGAFAAWGATLTPAIEGCVVDEETNKPIENVVIRAQWERNPLIAMGPTSWDTGKVLMTATGKDGCYRIPRAWRWTPFGLAGLQFQMEHWFYEGTGDVAPYPPQYKQLLKEHPSKWGIIRWDAKLRTYDKRLKIQGLKAQELLPFIVEYFRNARKMHLRTPSKEAVEIKWNEWNSRYGKDVWDLHRSINALDEILETK